ncbi:D-2-hydroxyacid dehydrogenase [Bacillus sp. FJAT-45037]|uniref:D-2-hydroxyacid dehydrogenase n=1 Tax=Bacillus sp. FJAT-45037 TaxID=2011007 RepID=UPI000C23328C|nr:D-2-hydroxyacid dehydrogenase [Bacillus sp. FJAT-45037]
MKINHILVISQKHTKLKAFLDKESLANEFRYLREEDVEEADLKWADAVVGFNLKRDFDLSQVKWVHSLGAGVDRFLLNKDWPEDVMLTRTVTSFGARIAEYSLSYILKDIQLHDAFQQLQEERRWEPQTPKLIQDQTVLLYGTGEIGQVAANLFSSLGMKVYGVSLSGKQKENFEKVYSIDSPIPNVEGLDYVINTLPLTKETEHLFDQKMFGQFSEIGFINVGRGASIVESDLLDALERQHVRFAVLDVFTEEPLAEDHSFWSHSLITITPHISAVTTPGEGIACFVKTLKAIEEEKPLTNLVDIKRGY